MRAERVRVLPALLVTLLFVGIGSVVLETPALAETATGIDGTTTDAIGNVIFDDFLAAFEIVAVLLVAALVGGVYLAKPDKSRGEAVREAVRTKPRIETDKEVDDGTE
ncbi:MAG: NADH-quinone oxidoreductase subunit J [Halobacteria archaeon]